MRNDPVFDPIFNAAPLHEGDRPAPQRMLFDGWSYQPLTTKREEHAGAVVQDAVSSNG